MRALILLIILLTPLTTSFADPVTVAVGISAPLSGDLVEYGNAVRNGIELAKSEAPAAFEHIQFIYEDNQYDATTAVSAYKKLREANHIDLLFSWGELPLHAIAPLVERDKLPTIAMSIDPTPGLGKRFIVRSINHSQQFAVKVIEHLRAKGFKRYAIVRTDDPFFNSMADGLKLALNSDESIVAEHTALPTDTDFKPIITRLRAKKFDALAVFLLSGQVSTFYKQAGTIGYSVSTFGSDVFESKTEITNAAGFMNGAIYPNVPVPQSFRKKYTEHFGNENQLAYAYNSHQFATLLRLVFANLKEKPDAAGFIATLSKIPDSLELAFTFKETPQGGKYWEFPLVIKRIEGTRFSDLTP